MFKRWLGMFLLASVFSMPLAVADEAPGAAVAAASSAPTVLTAPALVPVDKVSAGDTAWMLTSTALVLMMCIPGLALFYGGMVRKKNVLATLMQSFACTCVITILWWVIGYSWAFTPGNGFLGSSARVLFRGMAFIHDDAGSISLPPCRRACTRCSR